MNNEQNWQAVLDRDPAYEGRFVYAVQSTGIYCRPTCPSRRPNRPQVLFFLTAEEAEQAGFRACLRCRPNGGGDNEEHLALVKEMCRYMEEHTEEKLTLEALSERFHLSPFHLQRTFKGVTGVSPRQYAESIRSSKLKTGLREQKSVTEAIYEAGYGSSSSLYNQGAAWMGMTPAAYRVGGKLMEIEYTTTACSLGLLLVAATEQGICAVSLGSSENELEHLLAIEYPQAAIRRSTTGLARWVRPILEYLEGNQQKIDLPLDIQATAFQWRVWEALRAIPYGATRTYSQVANQIGSPGSARAVARACASNRAAMIIPCHRVIASTGKLSGYRWGVERKKALLQMEKQNQQVEA